MLYVGGVSAADNKTVLEEHQIFRVVDCQSSASRPFQSDPRFEYLHFTIGLWARSPKDGGGGYGMAGKQVLRYMTPLWEFVDRNLGEGRNVLVHCLAGAHRAGTAGSSCLMKFGGLAKTEAVATAQKARPAINPIGTFPELLTKIERALTDAADPRAFTPVAAP